MILFLDFDGVLHPNNLSAAPFTWAPRLAAWLQAWPDVDVVISSSWRLDHMQHEMVEMLGWAIGERVVGCTPSLRLDPDGSGYPAEMTTDFEHERQTQIAAWMASSWDPGRAWVALDDMDFLFAPSCPQLVVCDGRHGLSHANVQELDGHAQRAGLTQSLDQGIGSRRDDSVEIDFRARKSDRILTLEKYLKHSFSCLPDGLFRITVDRDRCLVTITSAAFDSHLVGWLVTRILPEEHGIVAYRDDNAGWIPPAAPYDLRVRIGGETGIELDAQVVLLSSAVDGGVSVRLSEPKLRTAEED